MLKRIFAALCIIALCIALAREPLLAAEYMTSDEMTDGYAKVYRYYKNDNMEIALTFDDGPHPVYTLKILEILEKYDIKATFFMIGENVCNYTEIAKLVRDAGHEIGNHTSNHLSAQKLGEDKMKKELMDCADILFNQLEYETRIVRPPEGAVIDSLLRCCGSLEYSVILWNIDTMDWAHKSPHNIYMNVVSNIDSGDIILMHDYIGKRSPTPEALELIIPKLLEMGYRFVTVSELIEAGD